MEKTLRAARCADELASAVSGAQIRQGRYLVHFTPAPHLPSEDECCAGMGDNHHFPMGTEPLRLGFTGVRDAAASARGRDAAAQANLDAIQKVYNALAGLHERAGLNPGAPRDFFEALQLFSTLWRMRSIFGTAAIGRLDQYLYPFYQIDPPPRERALGALCEFFEALNDAGSGDTLITVLLGGSDENGEDETNDVSLLMLDASLTVRKSEPHVSVRLHKRTRGDFTEKALELMALGHGQATVYYDENIIPELVAVGIPRRLACRYVNNGCTEIMLDGQGLIEFENVDAVKALELALFRGEPPALPAAPVGRYWTVHQPEQVWETSCHAGFDGGDALNAPDYETIERIYLRQFDYQLRLRLGFLRERVAIQRAEGAANALLNGSFPQTLTSGGDVVRGDLGHDCLMVFSGSLPTAADGLAAIKDVVFDKRLYTMADVLEALRDNFQGHDELRARLIAAPKFGNDFDLPDGIAARLQSRFCDTVAAYGQEYGMLFWPALIGYKFVQEALVTGATPDGRRWRDPIGEHFSPTPGRARLGPTAILCSAAKAPLKRAFGVAPVHLSLSRRMVDAPAQNGLIAALVRAAGEMGFNMLNIAVYDEARLRAAQRDPEHHADVIVRVWGYSARFIDLSPEMQEHVIRRVAGTNA